MQHRLKKMGKIFLLVLAMGAIGMFTLAAADGNRAVRVNRFTAPSGQQEAGIRYLLYAYTKQQLETGVYVGSEYCLACHEGFNPEAGEWRHTKHAYFIRKPMAAHSLEPGKGVMANSLAGSKDDFVAGLDFNAKTGTPFDELKPNAPILSYDQATDKYYVQIGATGLKMVVAATLAGQSVGNGQRYMVRIPVSDTPSGWSKSVYFAPVAWSGSGWSVNAKSSWYTSDFKPKYNPGIKSSDLGSLQSQNYMKTCSGCHITGIRSVSIPADPANGEYEVHPYPAVLFSPDSPNYPDLDGDGLPDMANIGCESCHGPGSAHILGHGDINKIVNPKMITNNQDRSKVCLQCHVQIASAPSKTWGFTYDDKNNKPFVISLTPDSLDNYQVFTGGKWPDGWNYVGARIDTFKSSDHYQGAFGHGIACNDCHDAHAETSNDAQVRDKLSEGNVPDIPANVDNDSFCLACHATHGPFASVTHAMVKDWSNNLGTIRDTIEAHTHHPYGADRSLGLSRCITCHMAPTAGHGGIEGASHTFWVARPEDTIALKDAQGTGNTWGSTGNVNSCSASCHRGFVKIWSDVGINPNPGDNKFNTPDELNLAGYLVKYFGPDGIWWNTKK